MSRDSRNSLDRQLDALFEEYREACIVPDASVNFMPTLWAQVDSRRRFQLEWRRWVQGLVTLTAVASLAMAILEIWPAQKVLTSTYVEVLSAEHDPDHMTLQDVALLEVASPRTEGPERH